MSEQTTISPDAWVSVYGWRTQRNGAALDLLDGDGKRVAWRTADFTVYVERAVLPNQLRAISEWAEKHD